MYEYTTAFLKPFSWAKQAYDYMLGTTMNKTIELTEVNMSSPSLPDISNDQITIKTDFDWNYYSKQQVAYLGAIYQTTDQAEVYYNSLYSSILSRVSESEKRLQEQESAFKALLSSTKLSATTSINLKGGDSSSLEKAEKYHRTFGPLQSIPEEGLFRLKDTGFFSSIRSFGGFAGTVTIEYSLGEIVTNGNLQSIVDGSRSTFWSGTFYAPAPIKADENDIHWLPSKYRHGYACMITYNINRPTLATEVFVDPVTTEPLDLVSISWTPFNLENTLYNGTFETSGNWVYTDTAYYAASSLGLGVASGACLVVGSVTGWASQTFVISGQILETGQTELVTKGKRCSVTYSMMGRGDLFAGVRLLWLDTNGNVIDYKIKEDYPTGFYTTQSLVDYIPSNAVSGRIELGIFTPATVTAASAFFDSVLVQIGEKQFQVNEVITGPTTISLPEVARSSRFSFVFAQRNPRRETLAKESASFTTNLIPVSNYLDSSLQKASKGYIDSLNKKGPGISTFAYRIGLKELDLRYREYIPRGSVVSLPLITRREIREIWATVEHGNYFNENTKFYIYPFADDVNQKIEITPFRLADVSLSQSYLGSEGEILKIYTTEEQENGWVPTNQSSFITNYREISESFDGTSRDSKIRLTYCPHLRKTKIKDIQSWLSSYSIWPTNFDPNLSVVYGLEDSTIIDAIRNGSSSGFELTNLISTEGYIPIKVTIQTGKWTAHPDLYGRPDISKVRTALLEPLISTTVVETQVDTKEDIISFESFLNLTFRELSEKTPTSIYPDVTVRRVYGEIEKNPELGGKTPREFIETMQKSGTKWQKNAFKSVEQFKKYYEWMKNKGLLPKESTTTKTRTSAIEINDVYATRFKPIITGKRGTFLNLYWFDASNPASGYIAISPSNFEVLDANTGLIKLIAAPPASSYIPIADYRYINYSEVEDHFGSILSYANPASSNVDLSSNIPFAGKSYPITRNMTDYVDGRIPNLRPPNFDNLSKDYYPVIEYYVNNQGELILSRDFFKYGDIPAKINVEYQTLAIQPRLGVEVIRGNSPSVSPVIYNLSLRVKESSTAPLREIL